MSREKDTRQAGGGKNAKPAPGGRGKKPAGGDGVPSIEQIRAQVNQDIQKLVDKVDKKFKHDLGAVTKASEEKVHQLSSERYDVINKMITDTQTVMQDARDQHLTVKETLTAAREQLVQTDIKDLKRSLNKILEGVEAQMAQTKKKFKI